MNYLHRLLQYGSSPFQAAAEVEHRMKDAGFVRLDWNRSFAIQEGGRYYVMPYPSCVFAFVIGTEFLKSEQEALARVKIAMAHTDFPCFKIKPNPQYRTKGYVQLNVEPYGGMLKGTWFDRPLGIAGKVMLRSDDAFAPTLRLFDSKEAVLTIPSLAPHMDRESDTKRAYDMQQELQPLFGMWQGGTDVTVDATEDAKLREDAFLQYLSEKLTVEVEDILAYDLFLYNMDLPQRLGLHQEFLSAPRIDNLISVAALTESIAAAKPVQDIVMSVCFDNEEIGSRSKQGADSMLLPILLRKIEEGLHLNSIQDRDSLKGIKEKHMQESAGFMDALLRGFLLSVDGAHALHPNYVSKSDTTNEVFLGGGPVIKTSASQRYLSDGEGTAIVKQLCKECGITSQVQVNRSGMPGGQTLGPLVASYLPIRGADIGIPMLAMHSARELAAAADYEALCKLLNHYFCVYGEEL